MKPIAHIETGFKDKFGIPRQSGLAKGMDGQIIFEKEYKEKHLENMKWLKKKKGS